jgi:hypothetical protein
MLIDKSCKIDCDFDEPCKIISVQKTRARKEHKCMECNNTISAGTLYEKYVGVSENKIFKHKTCLSCLSIREVFFQNYWFGGVFEELNNEISQSSGNISEACIRELTPDARAIVCELIEEYWEQWFNEGED